MEGGGASHQQVWIVQEFCNRGSLFEAVDRGMLQLSGGTGPDLRAVLATAQEIAGGPGQGGVRQDSSCTLYNQAAPFASSFGSVRARLHAHSMPLGNSISVP